MSDLGAGIALTEDWDFDLDNQGDIATVVGLNELEKDIAFNVADALRGEIGRRVDQTTQKRIQVITQNELIEDDRIGTINSVIARRVDDNVNEFEVVASVDTETGPFDLVFEVAV